MLYGLCNYIHSESLIKIQLFKYLYVYTALCYTEIILRKRITSRVTEVLQLSGVYHANMKVSNSFRAANYRFGEATIFIRSSNSTYSTNRAHEMAPAASPSAILAFLNILRSAEQTSA